MLYIQSAYMDQDCPLTLFEVKGCIFLYTPPRCKQWLYFTSGMLRSKSFYFRFMCAVFALTEFLLFQIRCCFTAERLRTNKLKSIRHVYHIASRRFKLPIMNAIWGWIKPEWCGLSAVDLPDKKIFTYADCIQNREVCKPGSTMFLRFTRCRVFY